MNITIIAIFMIAVIIAAGFQKRIPMFLVLMFVPIAAAFGLGYSLTDISTAILGKMNSNMASAGYLLLFALIYFIMLTESGMFDRLINSILKPFGNHMNVVVLIIMTTAISLLCGLTAQISVTYLIVFPLMMPLYKKYGINRQACFILCQSALAVMMCLPWSSGTINVSMVLGCAPQELASVAIKSSLCMLPAIVLQWFYFAYDHKKRMGTWKMLETTEENDNNDHKKKDNKHLRPTMYWPNLLVFLFLMLCMLAFSVPPYLVFMIGAAYMIVTNYPKDFPGLLAEAGKRYIDLLMMIVGISVYLAVFMDMGMVPVIGELLTGIFPSFLIRYLHIFLLLTIVVFGRYIPSRVYITIYPVLIAIGAQFGINGMMMIAPFLINMTLATGSTPLMATNFLGCSLLEIDSDAYIKKAVRVQSITNVVAIIIGIVFGVIPV